MSPRKRYLRGRRLPRRASAHLHTNLYDVVAPSLIALPRCFPSTRCPVDGDPVLIGSNDIVLAETIAFQRNVRIVIH